MSTLSTLAFIELLALFDRERPAIRGANGQRLTGLPGWELRRTRLLPPIRSEWLVRLGYASHYPAEREDELVPVELEEDEDPERYRYRCPETFRVKYLPAEEAAAFVVSAPKLLHLIADLLDISQVHRRGIDQPLLDGTLWRLGRTRMGPMHVSIWLVRDLATNVDEVFRQFYDTSLPDQGLILTCGPLLPQFVRPPRNYRFAALHAVLIDYLPKPRFDIDLLYRILTAPADVSLRPVLPVYFDEYTGRLDIRGKTGWHVKGERQRLAIKYMYEQALTDRWRLDAGEILAAAYRDNPIGRSKRIQQLFSGNQEWKDYIEHLERGKFGFRID